MKQVQQFIFGWGPAIACMVLIFLMSSRPRFGVTQEYVFDFLIFKSLHVIEYFILYVLLVRAFYKSQKYTLKKSITIAVVFCLLYAISDELHQTLVPTRDGTLRDIFIDSIGIFIGYKLSFKKLDFIIKYF